MVHYGKNHSTELTLKYKHFTNIEASVHLLPPQPTASTLSKMSTIVNKVLSLLKTYHIGVASYVSFCLSGVVTIGYNYNNRQRTAIIKSQAE